MIYLKFPDSIKKIRCMYMYMYTYIYIIYILSKKNNGCMYKCMYKNNGCMYKCMYSGVKNG